MPSISLFEQLTSSVLLSVLTIVFAATLVLLLVYIVACRFFFALSTSKARDSFSNQEKKANIKNQQDHTTSSNKKKNAKTKKTAAAISSSSPSAQSEESDNEKAALVISTKQPTTGGKKIVAAENNKTSAFTKQQTAGKGKSAISPEVKRAPTVDGEADGDHKDEGQWVTQGSRQINNRNRNKGKSETSSSTLTNPNVVSETRSLVTATSPNDDTSSLTNNLELSIPSEEPIEIYQLFPKTANPYTVNDNWWKQTLNKQQTFSIDDIGEWPEREEEQYTVQIKRIIPVKKSSED